MTSRRTWALTGAFFIAVFIGVAAAHFGALGKTSTARATASKSIPVKVVIVQRRTASTYLSSVGTVQAFNTVLVRPRVDGVISKVLFEEGKGVQHGDILLELDRRPFEVQLQAAYAQKDKDLAQFKNTELDLRRYESLAKLDSIAIQTLDTTKALVAQLRATLKADQAQIDQAKLQLDYATIRAPISGRLGARLVDIGNVVHANDTNGLVVLSQIRPVFVSFSLPQSMLSKLRQQQEKQAIRVQALSQDGSALEEGELTLIDSQVDAATGTIHCKARFKNETERLWPGAFVNTRIMLDELPNAVVVSSEAIQAADQYSFVYVVLPNHTVQARRVQPGSEFNGSTVILAGLTGGEHVVVEGQFQLEDGAHVDEDGPQATLPNKTKTSTHP